MFQLEFTFRQLIHSLKYIILLLYAERFVVHLINIFLKDQAVGEFSPKHLTVTLLFSF